MTNQPDESHPLRSRVDEAISWFTQTDEPPEPTAAPVTDSTPAVEDSAPVAETAPVVERSVPVGEGRYAVDESAPVEEGRRVATESLPVEEGTDAAEPAVEVPPTAAVEDASLNTPVAADLPGNQAAPVDIVSEPVTSEPVAAEPVVADEPAAAPAFDEDVAPERVYEADEFSTHPVGVSGMSAAPEPTDVAPERLSEADDFVPVAAAAQAATVAEPVATEPVVGQVEASDVDEPTRIHPIEPPSSWAEVHPDAQGHTADEVEAESEAAAAQRAMFRDEAPTVALPLGAAAADAAAVPAVEQTAVMDAQEAARVRREERATRDRQLGKVIAAPDDSDEPLITKFTPPTTYKPLPSLGFLIFRVVIAAVVGLRAWQHITHLSATREMWSATLMPSPGIVTWVQIGVEIAVAVMLLVGLGTRIAGVLLLALSVALLAFVQWGVVSPFQNGAADFIGVVEVLLAGAGVLFATVGGGRIAFDGYFHVGRIRRKNDKLFS